MLQIIIQPHLVWCSNSPGIDFPLRGYCSEIKKPNSISRWQSCQRDTALKYSQQCLLFPSLKYPVFISCKNQGWVFFFNPVERVIIFHKHMRSIHICFIYLYVWKCVCVCACVYRCELEPKTDTRVFLSHSSPCLLRGHLSLSLRLADLARLRPASLLAHLPLSPPCLVVTSGNKTPVCVLAQRAFNPLQELPMRLRDYS